MMTSLSYKETNAITNRICAYAVLSQLAITGVIVACLGGF